MQVHEGLPVCVSFICRPSGPVVADGYDLREGHKAQDWEALTRVHPSLLFGRLNSLNRTVYFKPVFIVVVTLRMRVAKTCLFL